MTRKINMTVEGIVHVPVKVTLDVMVRADDDATMKQILGALAKGKTHHGKFDIEEISVESAEFHQLLDEEQYGEESLESQIGELFDQQATPIIIDKHEVYDSR